ncbi:hypothetical protein ACQKGI_15350 [Peribacillus muralis]|uniref:Spore coat protein n=2 Tax=Peribacillus muralis TaxID=264697 RepID=A0A1B3XUW6_9BACI|nr:hypothetical protein ABE28_021830 [Peribacillus muralis]
MEQQNSFNNQQQSTGLMKQPPEMVSVKDSLYLADMLAWNLNAIKKAHFFATQCKDPQIIDALNRCGLMHQRHYDTILNHLDPNQAQTQQQFQ